VSYSRINPLTVVSGVTYTRSNGGPQSSSSIQTYNALKTGERVTKFRDRIKRGVSATSPYTATQYEVSTVQGVLGSSYGITNGLGLGRDLIVWESGQGVYGALPSEATLAHLTTDTSVTEAEALSKLYERIKAVRSQMNGLQFLGELREALHMIRHPADALLKGLRNYHDALKSRTRGITKYVPVAKRKRIINDVIAGTWLEYSYGWKPLLNDVKDIAETVGRQALKEPPRERVSSSRSSTPAKQMSTQITNVGQNGRIPIQILTEKSSVYGVRWTVGLSSSVVAPVDSLTRIAELSGFTLENFVPTIWELISLSFVAEYFSNIGDIIEASFASTAGITWISKTVRTKTDYFRQALPGNWISLGPPEYFRGTTGAHLGKVFASKTSIVRSVPSSLPIPNLILHLPGTENKYANLGALAMVFSRETSSALSGKLRI